MKATSRCGPRWNQVRRRVTVNDVTKRVLADQMVEEIRDPFERLDRAVDLLTVLYYDGAIAERELIMRGGQADLREDGEGGRWRPVTPAEGDLAARGAWWEPHQT